MWPAETVAVFLMPEQKLLCQDGTAFILRPGRITNWVRQWPGLLRTA
jgi:hypothetical protein